MFQRSLLILLIATCTLPSGCDTSRRVLGYVLDETEVELGTQLAAQIEEEQRLHSNRRLQSYIQRIAEAMIPFALEDRPGIEYHIKVIDAPEEINAFAVPGGFIYVYSGLLLVAEDEAEIAGVLAHEIGHIVGRHSINQLAARLGMGLLITLTLGEDLELLGQIGASLASARFSRDDEREADTFGVRYSIAAGYDPHGLLRFFCKTERTRRASALQLRKALRQPPAHRRAHPPHRASNRPVRSQRGSTLPRSV